MYSLFADLVLTLHLLFILYVSLGALMALWRPWLILLHLPALLWGVGIELYGWVCPLTPLENHFRLKAGGDPYQSTFIERYLLPIIYPSALTREIQLFLAACLVVINAPIYWLVVSRRCKCRQPRR
ncbi:MAG: DUF2784 domain-containing protein [Deltaproteobacteria bacterium]|nr:DUF2784 domain-containing protein [Deltaproteobacteria bacterium]